MSEQVPYYGSLQSLLGAFRVASLTIATGPSPSALLASVTLNPENEPENMIL